MSRFAIYRFDVQAGVDPMEWASLEGMPASVLAKEVDLKHHSELLSFVMECQTYPTSQSKLLALEIANFFNPAAGKAWPTQGQLASRLGVGREVIRKYSKDLVSTGYWEVQKDPVTGMLSYHLSPETMVVLSIWLKRVRKGQRDYGFGTPSLILKADKARPNNRVRKTSQPVEPSQEPSQESTEEKSYRSLVENRQPLTATHSVAAMAEGQGEEAIEAVARIVGYWEQAESLNAGESFHLIKRLLAADREPEELMGIARNLVLNRKR